MQALNGFKADTRSLSASSAYDSLHILWFSPSRANASYLDQWLTICLPLIGPIRDSPHDEGLRGSEGEVICIGCKETRA